MSMWNNLQGRLINLRNKPAELASPDDRKFGTFSGVFVPTVLTILGVIMYLRLAWVVGNAGLIGAILIIVLAHVVTISTGLAVSSIATNIRVGAGGAFSIISQSLGLEVGGSVGMTLYFAQGISIAMYIIGFAEGVVTLFPAWPIIAVIFGIFLLVFIIAYVSAQLASRVQFIILAIVALSLVSVFLGAFPSDGQPGAVYTPQLMGDFPDGNFWTTFAVYFPAVTGIMVGISLSGTLKNPRKNIPIGTMSAIAVTFVIYLLLVFWLSRVATTDELLDTSVGNIVMANKARWGLVVLLGLLGATFSSALGSMVAAPRVMQALGQHEVVPKSKFFAEETAGGEPRNAMLITGAIALGALLFAIVGGGLDAIAPLITMFFLLTYGTLNGVVLIEQNLGMVSFRPTFSIPRIIPFIGLVSCLAAMLLIAPIFGVLAIIFTFAIYIYLVRKQLRAPWNDVRSGLFIAVAEWASQRVTRMPSAPERTWRPNILAPVTNTKTLTGSYRFLRSITNNQGSVHCLGLYEAGDKGPVADLDNIANAFMDDGINARSTKLEAEDFEGGLNSAIELLSSDFIRPNILFMTILNHDQPPELQPLLDQAREHRMGMALLARHKQIEMGREQIINVWVREQGPAWELSLRLSNLDLSVLLAYQLAGSWRGRINLCMVVDDEDKVAQAQDYLKELSTLARLPSRTEYHVFQGDFWQIISNFSRGDINFFGLPRLYDPDFVGRIFETVDASCLFVRDSGDESALA